MRVRHKQSGDILNLGDGYELVTTEPPPDRWHDVTGECDLNDHYELFHIGGLILSPMCAIAQQTYRLRKVRLGKYPDYDMRHPNFIWQDVFIVERKVSL